MSLAFVVGQIWTIYPGFAEALEKWRESVSGASEKWIGISSVSLGVGGVFLEGRS